jgi:hypothetical protein
MMLARSTTSLLLGTAVAAALLMPAGAASAQSWYRGRGYYPYAWRHYDRPGSFEFHRWRLPPERRLRYTDTPIYERWGGYDSPEGLGYPFAEDYSRDSFFRRQVDASRFDQPVPSGRFEGASSAGSRGGVPVLRGSLDHLMHYPAPTLDDPGWDLIGEGEAVKALGRFTAQKMTRPGDVLPMIGYAIAAAMYDDDRTALWTLREAMRIDPDLMHSFEASDAVADQIRGLIDAYAEQSDETNDDGVRATLLAAAMHCLLHEYDEADELIADLDASEGGVRDVSAFIAAAPTEGEAGEATDEAVDDGAGAKPQSGGETNDEEDDPDPRSTPAG